jgi:hypothetical protein
MTEKSEVTTTTAPFSSYHTQMVFIYPITEKFCCNSFRHGEITLTGRFAAGGLSWTATSCHRQHSNPPAEPTYEYSLLAHMAGLSNHGNKRIHCTPPPPMTDIRPGQLLNLSGAINLVCPSVDYVHDTKIGTRSLICRIRIIRLPIYTLCRAHTRLPLKLSMATV